MSLFFYNISACLSLFKSRTDRSILLPGKVKIEHLFDFGLVERRLKLESFFTSTHGF